MSHLIKSLHIKSSSSSSISSDKIALLSESDPLKNNNLTNDSNTIAEAKKFLRDSAKDHSKSQTKPIPYLPASHPINNYSNSSSTPYSPPTTTYSTPYSLPSSSTFLNSSSPTLPLNQARLVDDYVQHNYLNNAYQIIHKNYQLIPEIDHANFWQKCLISANQNFLLKSLVLLSQLRQHYKNNLYLPTDELMIDIDFNHLYQTLSRDNKRLLKQSILIFFNRQYGEIIYFSILQHFAIVQALHEILFELDSKENQNRYPEIFNAYQNFNIQSEPFLNLLLQQITFDEKFIFAEKHLNFNRLFRFIVAGRTGLGKSTLIRSFFKDFLEESELPQKSDGKRGEEKPFTVSTRLSRPFKEEEKFYQQKYLPEQEEFSLTFSATDIGGFAANQSDDNLIKQEKNLINLAHEVIERDFKTLQPINLMLYLLDDRVLEEDIKIIKKISKMVPVIMIKSKSPKAPSLTYIEKIKKYELKNCYYLYSIVSEAYTGANGDGIPIHTPISGMKKLVEVMAEAYYNNFYRWYFQRYYNLNFSKGLIYRILDFNNIILNFWWIILRRLRNIRRVRVIDYRLEKVKSRKK